jgi:hypothetical protein
MASKFVLSCTLCASVAVVHGFGGSKMLGSRIVKLSECIDGPSPADKPDCEDALEQSPADVTNGAVGLREPVGTLVTDYAAAGMCLVNIHWHLGAEHMSEGQYDIQGQEFLDNVYVGKDAGYNRRLLASEGDIQAGWMCDGYDPEDPTMTTEYDWQHCEGMNVGLTYEIHWPHSSAGHCGHLTDGLGGVFCTSHAPEAIGVQGQVFMVVNDDKYDVDDLSKGMLPSDNIAMYTGSTTGPSHNNEICSPYAPISWHVDRDCHKVSAKSFDNLCKVMKDQGMGYDLAPHGSRELVDPQWVSNIPMRRLLGDHHHHHHHHAHQN